MTSKSDILEWLNRGKEKGATHMIVVCDTFDYEDYPVFTMNDKETLEVYNRYKIGANMQRVMEVYDLSKDFDEQLNTTRVFNLPY